MNLERHSQRERLRHSLSLLHQEVDRAKTVYAEAQGLLLMCQKMHPPPVYYEMLLVQCAWCKTIIRWTRTTSPKSGDISHGICSACYEQWMLQLN